MTIEASRRIAASPAAAWRLLAEPAQWPAWGPALRGVDCDDQEVGVGTTGRIRTGVGPWVPFRVTEVDPGHRWVWRVAGIPATGHRVEPDPEGCRVVFELPSVAVAYLPVCELALRRVEQCLVAVRA